MFLSIYRFLTSSLIEPFLKFHLYLRLKRKKEDPARYRERYGISALKRPPGPLIWFHAASVGESLSILSLVERLNELYSSLNFLITTSTVSSAQLIKQRLPQRTIHQFAPLDAKRWVKCFLTHWRPELALWVESELWPNLIFETAAQKIPLILLNARLSDRSYQRWQKLKSFIKPLLNCFSLCISPSLEQASRLKSLGASQVITLGNLKFSSKPLNYQENNLIDLQNKIGHRPLWLAASTHSSEEILIAEAHTLIQKTYPDILTIILPRHPHRSPEIIGTLNKNFKIAQRSIGELPLEDCEIYLCDTLGETGLFYRLVDIVFVGGSLVPIGGHNLIEPALLNSAILHGPYTHKSRELVILFQNHQASIEVQNVSQLAEKIIELLRHPSLQQKLSKAAFDVASAQSKTLEYVISALSPYLNQIGKQP